MKKRQKKGGNWGKRDTERDEWRAIETGRERE